MIAALAMVLAALGTEPALLSAPESMQWVKTADHQVSLEVERWVREVQNRTDPKAIEWARSQQELSTTSFRELVAQGGSTCSRCTSSEVQSDEYPICVLISLSMPISSLLALSEEVSKVSGCFVLRGIPENSWASLASKLIELDGLGVNVPILIDPRLFEEWKVSQVPAFIVREGDRYDKVSGNITLSRALELLAEQGETLACEDLLEELKKSRMEAACAS
jgi:conjugal transfer pilus assembly protein TrbC